MLNTSFAVAQTETRSNLSHRSVESALRDYKGDDCIHVLYPQRVRNAAERFLSGFPGTVMYAVKSNPHPVVLTTLWETGIRQFDVASIREIDLVKGLFPAAKLFLMHPIKSRLTIRHAYGSNVRDFSFDHEDELVKILDETGYASDLNLHLRLSLPELGAKMPLGGKFGANKDEAVKLLIQARKSVQKLGVCFHVGSQCLNTEAYTHALAYVRDLIDISGVSIDTLDLGGGFPVSYPDMKAPEFETYFANIKAALGAYKFDHLDVFCEPGRALCAAAGSTLARVELRKGQDLYLNDGTYGSLFDAGQFAWKFPVKLHRNRPPAPMRRHLPFRFFGPTCDSSDTMNGPFYLPADTCEGDWIEIEQLGAYGQTLATKFNGFYSETTLIIDETES